MYQTPLSSSLKVIDVSQERRRSWQRGPDRRSRTLSGCPSKSSEPRRILLGSDATDLDLVEIAPAWQPFSVVGNKVLR
jgi:hypothetical protein